MIQTAQAGTLEFMRTHTIGVLPVLNFSEYEPWRIWYRLLSWNENSIHFQVLGFSDPKIIYPALHFCEYEPWRTWYRFYGHVILEVYTIFGPESPNTSKCVLLSDLKTKGPGSVYCCRTWKTQRRVLGLPGPKIAHTHTHTSRSLGCQVRK